MLFVGHPEIIFRGDCRKANSLQDQELQLEYSGLGLSGIALLTVENARVSVHLNSPMCGGSTDRLPILAALSPPSPSWFARLSRCTASCFFPLCNP